MSSLAAWVCPRCAHFHTATVATVCPHDNTPMTAFVDQTQLAHITYQAATRSETTR